MTLAFFQGHRCIRKQKLLLLLFANFSIILDEIWDAVMTCWSVQAHARFICMIDIPGEDSALMIYREYV